MARASRRWLIAVVAIQIVLVAGMLHVDGFFDHVGMDFLTSYTAAEMVRDGAASSLYDTRAQWEYQRPIIESDDIYWDDRVMHPYIAPPALAVLSMSFLALGPSAAYLAWALLNGLAVATGVWLLARRLLVDWRTPFVVVAGSMPLFMVLMLGQVEGILFLAFVIFALEVREGREARAGVALAVFAIKPPLLLAPLLYLAVTGRRRAFWTTSFAVAAQAVASLALVGGRGVQDYIELSRRLSGPDGTIVTNVWGMVNVRSIVVRSLPSDSNLIVNAMILLLSIMTLAATAWFWRRSGVESAGLPSLALLAVTTVLTSYHALYHTATIALIGVVMLAVHAIDVGDALRADRVVAGSWAVFTALPLISFVVVQTSKVPAALGVAGIMALWAVAAMTVAHEASAVEAARNPRPRDLRPWYVVIRD
jgi:hypothetical protein